MGDTNNGGFSSTECELHRTNIVGQISALSSHVDLVERNLIDAIKQANRVSQIASEGHRDSLHATLQGIHENFERGSERFRAQEGRVAKLNTDLNNILNELQAAKLELQFVVNNKEDIRDLINTRHELDAFKTVIEGRLDTLIGKVDSTRKLVKRALIIMFIGLAATIVFESSGHDIKAAWDTVLNLLSKII